MKRKLIWMTVVALAIVSAAAVGCREPAIPPEVPPNPFTSVWGLGEKHVVTFSGDSAGHIAGAASEFTLELDNRAADIGERWQGEYCILLLDEHGVVAEIAHQHFDIPAGLKTHAPITVQFPADLDGPYGLSVLIPNRGQLIQTIWIGEKRPVDVGPWPVLDTCP
jgi:hypothetical protein